MCIGIVSVGVDAGIGNSVGEKRLQPEFAACIVGPRPFPMSIEAMYCNEAKMKAVSVRFSSVLWVSSSHTRRCIQLLLQSALDRTDQGHPAARRRPIRTPPC